MSVVVVPSNERPPMAVAMQWVSQITTVSLEMVLPAVLGNWLDGLWQTEPWLVVVGGVLGFTLGMYHLLQMVKVDADSQNYRDQNKNKKS